jgi:flagellin
MALTVNTNVSSLNAQRNLGTSQASLNTSLQRLSSGLRINSAKDDAAGLAISERFTSQIRGNEVAVRNANDGISLAQTAEGALGEIGNNLQRMRELAVQASNATNSDSDRASINNEIQTLSTEIDRVAQGTTFNGTKLLDGSFSSKTFQVGANNQATDKITIANLASARTSALGGAGASTQATVAGGVTTAALAAGDLTINGQQVGASTAGTGLGQTADSAYSVAAAINAVSGQSGVTATANETSYSGAVPGGNGAIAAGAFSINGVAVGAVADGGDAVGQGANVAAEINRISSQTGVTAAADSVTGAVTLTAADGRNIDIQGDTSDTGFGAEAAADSVVTTSTVTLESASDINISGGNVANAGLTAGATAAVTTTSANTISNMNVLTASNAVKALDTIDAALGSINSSRAELGAIQNRFSSVVSNTQATIENLSASRGRIQDTDFAKETANLSRAQVLQQAGTAMLSQANQSSQGVLSLLR